MKKLFVMAALVLSSVGAFAQYNAGDVTIQPKVGLNVTNLTGGGSDAKYKAGFVGGAELEYHVSPTVGISGGVLYSMQGTKYNGQYKSTKFDGNINLNYINIPILANVYVADGLALKAGVQPGFNVSSKISASPLELDIKDGVNSVDFSIPVGISYEYANVCLDARYNIGVTNTFKDSDNSRNSVFQLTLGYKFKL